MKKNKYNLVNKVNIFLPIFIGLVIGILYGYYADNSFTAYLFGENIVNSRFELILYYMVVGIIIGIIIVFFVYNKKFSIVLSGIIGAIISFIFNYLSGALIRKELIWCTNLHEVMRCYRYADFILTVVFISIFSIIGFIIGIIIGYIFDKYIKLTKRGNEK